MDIVRSSKSAVTFAMSLLPAPSTFINSSSANSCSMQEMSWSCSVLRYRICTRKLPLRRRRSVSTSISSICTSPLLSMIFSTSGLVSGTFISSSNVICTFFSNFKIPERTAFFSTFINTLHYYNILLWAYFARRFVFTILPCQYMFLVYVFFG